MKKISIFNNKGGVSKTTSTFHIGWSLANQGKKVLLLMEIHNVILQSFSLVMVLILII